MQTLTPQELTDLEDLAALAEGNLPEAERRRVLARIDGDDQALDLFASLLAMQEAEDACGDSSQLPRVELAAEPALHQTADAPLPANVRRFRYRTIGVAFALAAGIAVTIGFGLFTPEMEWTPSADAARILASETIPWSATRGAANGSQEGELLLSAAAAKRLGVLDIDLRAALRQQNLKAFRETLAKIKIEEPEEIWAATYFGLSDLELAKLPDALEELDHYMSTQGFDSATWASFEQGRCLRAGLAAASIGDAAFFESRAVKKTCDFTGIDVRDPESFRQKLADL